MIDEHTDPSVPCAHEEMAGRCPFCDSLVDADTRVCGRCKEMVEPVATCEGCGLTQEEIDGRNKA